VKHQQEIITKINQQPKPPQIQKSLETELNQTQQQLQTIEDTQAKEEAERKIAQIQQSLNEIKQNSLTTAINIDSLETKEPGIKDH